MKTNGLLGLCPIIMASLLSSCSPYAPDDQRAAICNELNSKMIFNGNTSNNRNSEIETSEYALLQRQYEKYHCDER
jgi:hypothetical protein